MNVANRNYCVGCKYEDLSWADDPCFRCHHESEYVYGGETYNNYPQSKRNEDGEDGGLQG